MHAKKSRSLYRLFGITLASDFAFTYPLPAGSGTPDVTFTCTTAAPGAPERLPAPLFTCPYLTGGTETTLSISVNGDCHVARYNGLVDFSLAPAAITAHLQDPADLPVVEPILLGDILSLWQELRGVRMLHASAAVINGHAVAFLASGGGGKTGLAAACARQGNCILTDDILAVVRKNNRFCGQPGYPALRMWPDQAAHFLERIDHLPFSRPEYPKLRIPVGPAGIGSFCPAEKPLTVLYVPVRRNGGRRISIVPLSRKDAFFVLLRNSFTAGMAEALGLGEERMAFFARMAETVPVRELRYPEGFRWYPAVVEAVREDTGSIPA